MKVVNITEVAPVRSHLLKEVLCCRPPNPPNFETKRYKFDLRFVTPLLACALHRFAPIAPFVLFPLSSEITSLLVRLYYGYGRLLLLSYRKTR
jgi:hypothetical protein